jgi:hypothetical protein
MQCQDFQFINCLIHLQILIWVRKHRYLHKRRIKNHLQRYKQILIKMESNQGVEFAGSLVVQSGRGLLSLPTDYELDLIRELTSTWHFQKTSPDPDIKSDVKCLYPDTWTLKLVDVGDPGDTDNASDV